MRIRVLFTCETRISKDIDISQREEQLAPLTAESYPEAKRDFESLVEGDFIADQESPTVEEEADVREEEVRVVVVNQKDEEENTEKEVTEKESAENIVNASEFVGATTDNLE
ncbi:hypothetical protein V6Z12_D10G156500 [Gossypium hirsutum]|uniref:Uncharacterized protein n=1 Tax=Gossypium hirsutum TaxID=3635 RepID=A0A1U8KA10_GOSHI|nr:uncharacterized protein LOC107914805 [Gossypium hirsutum]